MGNRGVLHDDARRIVRAWQVRRWIACVLEFRGRSRNVMMPNRYTELFFLDEATALSAGHRPCAECRHDDYQRFRSFWQKRDAGPANADAIDARIHADRIAGRRKRTYRENIAKLPDGTYVLHHDVAMMLLRGELHEWSDSGYRPRRPRPRSGEIEVLTPRAIVEVLAAGYSAKVHSSAE